MSPTPSTSSHPSPDPHVPCWQLTSLFPSQTQGLNNAVALDFDYREQMIYWTDVTTQGSMIRRMHLNGSNVQVKTEGCPMLVNVCTRGPGAERHTPPHSQILSPLLLHHNQYQFTLLAVPQNILLVSASLTPLNSKCASIGDSSHLPLLHSECTGCVSVA